MLNSYYPFLNGSEINRQASLKHSHDTSNPDTGTYSAKLTVSGVLEQQSQCATKGTLFTADYRTSCTQPKAIKVKVVANASGTSLLDYSW